MTKRKGITMRMKRSFVQPGMPFEHYQGIQALNVSLLKEITHSPAMYLHRRNNPKTSPAMTKGTAAHMATLEPERFDQDYVVWTRRTETGRAAPRTGKAWEEFVAAAGTREILNTDEHATALAIAQAVRSDPIAARYIAHGEPEVTLVWTRDKRPCKGRVDWLTELDGEPVLVGLKTARDCRPAPFAAAAARLGYALQWAWYFEGFQRVTGRTPRMVEIVVDAEAPHSVVTYVIPEDVLGYGAAECDRLIETLERCERDNRWPGPAETELMFTLPAWAWRDDDAEDLGGGEELNWEAA